LSHQPRFAPLDDGVGEVGCGLDDPDPAEIVLKFSQSDEYVARTGPAIEDFLADAEAGTQDYRGHLLDTNDDGTIDEHDAGFVQVDSIQFTDGMM